MTGISIMKPGGVTHEWEYLKASYRAWALSHDGSFGLR